MRKSTVLVLLLLAATSQLFAQNRTVTGKITDDRGLPVVNASVLAKGTTIGHKRILKIEPVETDRIRINITSSRACPLISSVAVY